MDSNGRVGSRARACAAVLSAVAVGSLMLAPGPARGDLLEKVRDIFGISSGADKVKDGMTEFALTLRETTNQLGALVADLYGGDPVRAARARAVFQGILGRPLNAGEIPALGLSVQIVSNAPSQSSAAASKPYAHPIHVDVWPAGTEADEWVTLRFASKQNTAFIANPINVVGLRAETRDDVKARVLKASSRTALRENMKARGCNVLMNSKALQECAEQAQADTLATAILSVLPEIEAAPAVSTHTHKITGGFFGAILARKPQLEALLKANPDAAVEAWVHDLGPTKKRQDAFKTTNWNAPVSDWLRRCVDSGTQGVGSICYVFVDLKMASIAEYFAYIEDLKKRSASDKKAGS